MPSFKFIEKELKCLGPEFRKTHEVEGEAAKIYYRECIRNETFKRSN